MITPSKQGAWNPPSASVPPERKWVCGAGVLLFGLWLSLHFRELTGDQDGTIRFFIGILLALLILVRSKPVAPQEPPVPFLLPLIAAAAGATLVSAGLILSVRPLEWPGILLILFGALSWAMPRRARGDTLCALALLCWIHPLPGRVFDALAFQMQQGSVLGAERLLHCGNVAAWGDALVIRAGGRAFEVARSCSGLKTAISVLLFSFGIGVLRRMRALEIGGLMLLGLTQVLALNMVRIAVLVKRGAARPADWAPQSLHDTVGVFLLLAILCVAAEAAAWQAWQRRRQRRRQLVAEDDFVGEPEDKAHRLPVFWQWLRRWWPAPVAGLLLAGLAAGLIYKGRPHHRAQMILRVAEGLSRSSQPADLEHAARAAEAGLALEPGNAELRQARIRLLYLRNRFAEMVERLKSMPAAEWTDEQRVMEAQALFMLRRPTEAMSRLASLPPALRNVPGVALISAEFAVQQNQPAGLAADLLCAAQEPGLADRIRELFLYLAAHDQWQTILDVNSSRPYRKPEHALLVANAYLRRNQSLAAGAVLRPALARWPDDPLFLDPLMALTLEKPGGEWEEQFSRRFERNLFRLSQDDLARFMRTCFIALRPDLAWQAYRRLARLDPQDPALFLAVALHADVWFTFRRQWLGLPAESADPSIDLRPFGRLTRAVAPWATLWREVPCAEEILMGDPTALRRKYFDLCLAELRRRQAAGPLPLRLQKMYPRVLAQTGRLAEAQQQLLRLEREHPEGMEWSLTERARLYLQEARWAEAYEVLREIHRRDPCPPLAIRLMYARVLRQLNLDALALLVLDEARQMQPASETLHAALAETWDGYGFPEEALFALSPAEQARNPALTTRLLYQTERIVEARRVAVREGLSTNSLPDRRQNLVPAPAELAVQWNGEPLRPGDYDHELAMLDGGADRSASPYLQALQGLLRDWLRGRGEGGVVDPARWRLAGRDEREQAQALTTLALLLARQGRMEAARSAIRGAAAKLPTSSVIQRLQVALTQGDPEGVRAARRHCPADPEIWLAGLVSRQRREPAGDWAQGEVRAAARDGVFAPGTFVRAGDFLLRQGLSESAAICAQAGLREGRGLLPAYALGIRCALAQTNRAWALACTIGALENAVEPWPFYALLADLKADEKKPDADMIRAVEQLAERFPQDTRWAEWLGRIHFQRGEMDRALGVLEPAIPGRGGPVRVRLLAAEAARQEGKVSKAIALLEEAQKANPDDPDVINNLVYSLAQTPATLPRAVALMARLTAAEPRWERLDTLALVHLKSGNVAKAAEYMDQALRQVQRGDYAWHEVYLHAAEIDLAKGDLTAARQMVAAVRQDNRRSSATENQVQEILRKMPKEQDGKKR